MLEQAKNGVCLGTDYDGLINAIDCCKYADGLDGMYENLQKRFTPYFLQKTTGLQMTALEIKECIEGLFFNNSKACLDKWFVNNDCFNISITNSTSTSPFPPSGDRGRR